MNESPKIYREEITPRESRERFPEDIASVIIKPDGFPYKDDVVVMLKAFGLRVLRRVPQNLPQDFVTEKLYDTREYAAGIFSET